ncbi:MAG: transcription antitermination factor NusB [Spirochaetaceae bacterium]|jgi:N utilization substance protein B|nr:transcription antitermination factor NusB [Spirochaetaceae bacterium]
MSRSQGRVLAFQAVYAWEAAKTPVNDLCEFEWEEAKKLKKFTDADFVFAKLLIAGTIENIDSIDQKIILQLRNWDFSRLKRVDLAILRISVYALVFQKDVPATVVIGEAVKLCIEFGTDDSYKFVNGVLDNIKKTLA